MPSRTLDGGTDAKVQGRTPTRDSQTVDRGLACLIWPGMVRAEGLEPPRRANPTRLSEKASTTPVIWCTIVVVELLLLLAIGPGVIS
jgi:hypothetical protein